MNFRPTSSTNSNPSNWASVNDMIRQLNKEQTTKVFKQPGGNSIVTGRLPYDGGYGSLYYDSDGTPRILIGIAPDGEIDIGVSIAGQDITTLYS